MSTLTLHLALEALLFAEGGPLTVAKLARTLETTEDEIRTAATALTQSLAGRGIALLSSDDQLALVVAPTMQEVVARVHARDDERDIGDAGLEVLAILLYEGPASRNTIDYIRGVNSSSTLRTLLARGMVDRTEEGREYRYAVTPELLAHLGVTERALLPEFSKITGDIARFTAQAPHHVHE